MKTVFVATIALGLMSGTAAMAAPDYNYQGEQHRQQSQNDRGQQHRQQAQKPNASHRAETQNLAHSQPMQFGKTKYKGSHAKGEYRYNGKTYKAMQGPVWRAPKGYEAHRVWHRGDSLPESFRDRAYVVDYNAYHLQRPPYGYQWVRVNNSVYLVQIANGVIAQIVWNMFY